MGESIAGKQNRPCLIIEGPPPNSQKFVLYSHSGPCMNKRPIGLITPPFKINFLATKN